MERHAITPGPGAYDPKRLGTSRESYSGSAAFKSHTDRGKHSHSAARLSECGDPGEYNVIEQTSIATQSKTSFQTSSKAGKGGFGGTHKRDVRLSNSPTHPPKAGFHGDVEDTPGAGTYQPLMTEDGHEYDMWIMNGSEKMKSASFATATKRPEPALPNWKNPSAAEYHPKPEKALDPEIGNRMSKVGRKSKYVADQLDGGAEDSTTGPHVGPGSYEPIANKRGALDTIEKNSASTVDRGTRYKKAVDKSDSLAFGASGPQRELPFESHHGVASKAEATPEPGKYDPRVTEKGDGLTADAATLGTHNANAKKGTALFNVTSVAHDSVSTKQTASGWGSVGMMTDPGSYNPNHNREIEHQSKKTFQTRSKKGEGGFGGTYKRESRMSNAATYPPKAGFHGDVEDTPGAGTYQPLMTEDGHEYDMWVESGSEKMKSASFATTTKRPEPALPNWKNPAGADYRPNPEKALDPEIGNRMSKVGRQSKYVADQLDGAGDDAQTSALIGPGAYHPIRNNQGAMDTIELQMAEQVDMGFGTNASVTSGSFRTMFMSWLGLAA